MKIKYLPILFTLFFAKFSFAASDSSKPMQYNFLLMEFWKFR